MPSRAHLVRFSILFAILSFTFLVFAFLYWPDMQGASNYQDGLNYSYQPKESALGVNESNMSRSGYKDDRNEGDEAEHEENEVGEVKTFWMIDSGAHFYVDLPEEDIYDGREFIAFDHQELNSLSIGDRIEAYIPQIDNTYQAEIDSLDIVSDDISLWKGRVVEDGIRSGFVVISQRDEYTYMNISGPDGRYTIKAQDGYGWIHSSGALFSRPDGVVDN